MIFFPHIHRAAGSTVHSYFYPYFQPGGRHFVVSGWGELTAVAERIRNISNAHCYLGGHVGLHELKRYGIPVSDSDIVFSTVRDPLERAVSLYYLAQRSPDWFPHVDGGALDKGVAYFYQYMRENRLFFNNDHCVMLSGVPRYRDTVRLIKERFALVGACSHMADFEKALQELCAPIIPGFAIQAERVNAAYHQMSSPGHWEKRRQLYDVTGYSLAEKIRRDNDQDVLLVEYIEREHGGVFRAPERFTPLDPAILP